MPLAVEGRKVCTRCVQTKPVEEFPRNRSTPDGWHHYCKRCHREYQAARQCPRKTKDTMLRWKYDLTLDEYEAMRSAQGGVCAICKQPSKVKHDLHVDHDHRTGKVRALLCHHCNATLGNAKDDIDRLRGCVEYLLSHKEVETFLS